MREVASSPIRPRRARSKRLQVDLAPVRRLLGGGALPIFGDDPRSPDGRKVFSAAPLKAAGRDAGYVYVILQGESRESLAARVNAGSAANAMLWSMTLVALLGLMAGLAAFRLITRPLRTLTEAVRGLETPWHVLAAASQATAEAGRPQRPERLRCSARASSGLRNARKSNGRPFATRTSSGASSLPTSRMICARRSPRLHGYLETLRMKSEVLEPQEQRRYLDIALEQSRKVGRLAQEMFELARLEYGVVKPEMEQFFLADLLQDVFQKFELAAEAKHQRLVADIAPGLPPITADLAMMERVLMNLIDQRGARRA
ncbi:ATP-binding domain-containing protein [Alicycliphilus sp. B1]|nr:ATP-binding domain-containing protein [Alicycliphilus sp. B1]